MLRQYSLSLKTRFSLRLAASGLMIALNIIFAICGLTGIYGSAGKITAVTLSALIFCAWLVVCVLADYEIVKSLFSAPKGYHIFLAPVSSRKILLSRLAAILTWDIPGFVIGVFGIVVQSFLLAETPFSTLLQIRNPINEIFFIILAILQYLLVFLTIFLMAAFTKSIFFSKRARALLGILSGIVICYVMTFFDLILVPFTTVSRYGLSLSLSISTTNYLAMGIYLVLTLIKAAILFYITSYLMERKINI